jgi:hypothetical protein
MENGPNTCGSRTVLYRRWPVVTLTSKISSWIACIPTKIRNKYLPITNLKGYVYTVNCNAFFEGHVCDEVLAPKPFDVFQNSAWKTFAKSCWKIPVFRRDELHFLFCVRAWRVSWYVVLLILRQQVCALNSCVHYKKHCWAMTRKSDSSNGDCAYVHGFSVLTEDPVVVILRISVTSGD